MPSLTTLDLNLLVALDALLREGSVSRAARRVGLSQPAMSHALGRLRTALDDPLLVRSGRSMVPTSRASALALPLREALDHLQKVIEQPKPFEPATSTLELHITTQDMAQFSVMPWLIERVSVLAPGINIYTRTGSGPFRIREHLDNGEAALALSPSHPHTTPQHLFTRKLYDDPFVCVVSAEHPEIQGKVTLDQFCSFPHILVSLQGDAHGLVDDALAELGRKRRIAVVVPNFLTAPLIVSRTDYILTLPSSVLQGIQRWLPIQVIASPVELLVGNLSMIWHERTHHDLACQWLRKQVVESVEGRQFGCGESHPAGCDSPRGL